MNWLETIDKNLPNPEFVKSEISKVTDWQDARKIWMAFCAAHDIYSKSGKLSKEELSLLDFEQRIIESHLAELWEKIAPGSGGDRSKVKSFDFASKELKSYGLTRNESHFLRKIREYEKANLSWIETAQKLKEDGERPRRAKVKSYIELLLKRKIRKDKGKIIQLPDDIEIQCGDCKKLSKKIKDNSIDAIITDPPYGIEHNKTWRILAEIAGRILKPSGFLISYFGKMHLPEFFEIILSDKNLEFYWMIILLHSGQLATVQARKVNTAYKPILIFSKKPLKKTDEYWIDIITGTGREKDFDAGGQSRWAQAEEELDLILEWFTQPRDLILDPFAGTLTTLVAAQRMNRRCIGYEIDQKTIDENIGRLKG